MGRVKSAIAPTSVMTILITPAKIGRSMKKCGKFMEIGMRKWEVGSGKLSESRPTSASNF